MKYGNGSSHKPKLNTQDDDAVIIEKIHPLESGDLKVTLFIPASNIPAKKAVIETFFENMTRDLNVKLGNRKIK